MYIDGVSHRVRVVPVITVDNVQIVAQTQQLTSPSMHIKNANGEVYHVALVPIDGGIYDGSESLVYEENSINTCQSVKLTAGIYRVELRGGSGGRPAHCQSGIGIQRFDGEIVSSIFKLNQETTIDVFRGGDGNDSKRSTNNQVSGGGASGVDSLVIVNGRVIRAIGGVGTKCITGTVSGLNGGGYALFDTCYGGGGGVYSDRTINNGATVKYQARGFCGAGGGGSNDDGGGTGGKASSSYSFLDAGQNATSVSGGDGGAVENTAGTSLNNNVGYGGKGGANVTFSCGGQTATSYGGGGGGGMCFFYQSSCESTGLWCDTDCVNGGDGGTGSTGTSSTSFVKIYKIG